MKNWQIILPLLLLAACTSPQSPKLVGDRFVICTPTESGFNPQDYAKNVNALCVESCPQGYDEYMTQIGVRDCIKHYGEEEISTWPSCSRSSESCDCVKTTQTTLSNEIPDATYRCVPKQYAERLLFTSGQDRLDEFGRSSTAIA